MQVDHDHLLVQSFGGRIRKSNSYSETMLGFFWSLRQIFWIRGQPPIIV